MGMFLPNITADHPTCTYNNYYSNYLHVHVHVFEYVKICLVPQNKLLHTSNCLGGTS